MKSTEWMQSSKCGNEKNLRNGPKKERKLELLNSILEKEPKISSADIFTPEGKNKEQKKELAIIICNECSVRKECLLYAWSLKPSEKSGIFGGKYFQLKRK